jgi:hypothetical protein
MMKDSQHTGANGTNGTTAQNRSAGQGEGVAERPARERSDHASLYQLRERLRATARDEDAYQEALGIMEEYAEQFKTLHSAATQAEPSSLEDTYRQVLDSLEDHVLLKDADSTILQHKCRCAQRHD